MKIQKKEKKLNAETILVTIDLSKKNGNDVNFYGYVQTH